LKSEKTNKLALRVEKGLALKQKGELKFAEGFCRKTIWQQSGQISAKLVERLLTCSLKRTYNSAKFDLREKKGKRVFCGVLPVMRL